MAAACLLWAGAATAQQAPCDSPAMLAQSADALRQSLHRCQNNASYLARMGGAQAAGGVASSGWA